MSGVSQDQMETELTYLGESDIDYAGAKTDLLRCEIVCKRARARVFVAEEGSVEMRKAKAEGHADVLSADDALIAATLEFESIRAKRQRSEMLIEVWRTLEATRRRA